MKFYAALLSLTVAAGPLSATSLHVYGAIPNAEARAHGVDGYRLYANFPRLELVREGLGTANPELASLIQDPALAQAIHDGKFTSLQVRDLAIQRQGIDYSVDTIHVPFAVSLKHTQGSDSFLNGNQGTIEVRGEFLLHFTGDHLAVEVQQFDDSRAMEHLGRKFGYNRGIDLDFAREVVKPVLENYFNSDPVRILGLYNEPAPARP